MSLAHAYEIFKAGDLESSLQLTQAHLEDHPKDAQAYALLGLNYIQRRNMPDALEAFQKAYELAPNNQKINFNFAYCLTEAGELEAADSVLKTLIMRSKDFVEAYHLRALVLIRLNQLDEALHLVSSILEKNSLEVRCLATRGRIYFLKGMFDKAEQDFQWAKSLTPNHPAIMNNEGLLFMAMERFEEAARNFQHIIMADPNHIESRWNLFRCFALQNKWEEAYPAAFQAWCLESARYRGVEKWTGQNLADRHLRVYSEGDNAQFVDLSESMEKIQSEYPNASFSLDLSKADRANVSPPESEASGTPDFQVDAKALGAVLHQVHSLA